MKHSCRCHERLLRYAQASFQLQVKTLEIVTKLKPAEAELTKEQQRRFKVLLARLKKIDPDPTFPKKGR